MPSWSSGITLTGADGLSVLTGSGPPASTLGVINQAYIDVTNAVLYRKIASGWPSVGVSLTGPASTTPGPKGDSGQAGSVIYSASGSPPDATGVKGDYFYSSDTYVFFGPKPTATSWANATQSNLKGVKGDAGVATAGAAGSVIYSGAGSPPDATGIKGDYFYSSDSYIFYGPKPTATSWSGATQSNLKGAAGASGVGTAGADGKTIRNGTSAPTNVTANVGDFYLQTGSSPILYGPATAANTFPASGVSLVGPKGDAGAAGVGTAGADGKTVRSGASAPTNVTANVGDFYIQTSTPYTIYGPATAANTFPASGVSLVGPKGDAGAAGTNTTSSTVGASGLTFNDNTVQTTAYPGPIALSTNAPVPGPPCGINGLTLSSTAVPMYTPGTTSVQNYTTAQANAFYYVTATNYSNSAAAVFIQLYNVTDATAVWTSPNSLAVGSVTTFGAFTISQYPMPANKTYTWRVSGNGASYVNVIPQYFVPASAPFATQNPAPALLTQATTLSATAIATKYASTTNLTQTYTWPTGGYFSYALLSNFSTATTVVFKLVGGSTTLYTSAAIATSTTTAVGPFGPGAYPMTATTQYTWQVTGSGSATVAVNWQTVF